MYTLQNNSVVQKVWKGITERKMPSFHLRELISVKTKNLALK